MKSLKSLLSIFTLTTLFAATTAASQMPKDMLQHRLVFLPSLNGQWDKLRPQSKGEISPLVENIQTTLENFNEDTNNIAYVLAYKGNVIAENYKYGTSANSQLYGYSITKSIVGSLAILAACDKKLDTNNAIGTLSPRLKNTMWANVPVNDVANMASGVISNWDKKHRVSNFIETLERKATPLEQLQREQKASGRQGIFDYSGYDTNALGIFVEDQYKKKISSVFETRIWRKTPTTGLGFWQTTAGNENVSAFGLMMTGRDWVQVGRYIAHLRNSNSCFRDRLANAIQNKIRDTGNGSGYAYQFWLPNNKGSQVEMVGVDGQRILIDLDRDLVMFIYSRKDKSVSKDGWRILNSIKVN